MNIKKTLLAISLFISCVLIFISPVNKIDNITYAIGFPFKFIWYRSYEGMLENRFELFYPKNFIKIEFNIMSFLFSVLIIYILLLILTQVIKMIGTKKATS